MIRFFLKSSVLISVLLFGILIGMQQVGFQMDKMKGSESENRALEWNVEENGAVEAEVLGQNITSHDLQEKQKQLENVEAFNLFSKLGAMISSLISDILTLFMEIIGTILNKILYFLFS
ncbi:DUF3679 domain-containing protein [Pseudalkalibacillus berkeleyi]|uniref:YqxA family protein n=1 Tax=Pseudalkalibacillus berkeleyi TaxID=1069813 RepID=A0ABS9H205_9BACL|nr:DUF3679 domain-containing protein [Pseudalkalibacillus berkeleyi]MCF6137985.1 YqxA family protein [Pseudalkalibacillus berkeleyi]